MLTCVFCLVEGDNGIPRSVFCYEVAFRHSTSFSRQLHSGNEYFTVTQQRMICRTCCQQFTVHSTYLNVFCGVRGRTSKLTECSYGQEIYIFFYIFKSCTWNYSEKDYLMAVFQSIYTILMFCIMNVREIRGLVESNLRWAVNKTSYERRHWFMKKKYSHTLAL
jgi:hypothetical protein